MNKKYKKSFLRVSPRDDSVERIFDMTKKKKITAKPLLVAAIIGALLFGSMVSANAMTDGKVLERVRIVFNGEEKNPEEIPCEISSEVDENGEVYRYEISLENDNCYVEIEKGQDGDSIGIAGELPEAGFDYKVIDENGEVELDLCVPTTSVAQ